LRLANKIRGIALSLVFLIVSAIGCAPRIEVAGSEKPITINLNVKIDHEVRVRVDKELDDVISDKSGLF